MHYLFPLSTILGPRIRPYPPLYPPSFSGGPSALHHGPALRHVCQSAAYGNMHRTTSHCHPYLLDSGVLHAQLLSGFHFACFSRASMKPTLMHWRSILIITERLCGRHWARVASGATGHGGAALPAQGRRGPAPRSPAERTYRRSCRATTSSWFTRLLTRSLVSLAQYQASHQDSSGCMNALASSNARGTCLCCYSN